VYATRWIRLEEIVTCKEGGVTYEGVVKVVQWLDAPEHRGPSNTYTSWSSQKLTHRTLGRVLSILLFILSLF